MKKNISILLSLGLAILVLFMFSGCSYIIENKTYPRNNINQLFSKTDSQSTFNISYEMKKSQVLYNNINGLEHEVYRYMYEVKNTSLKRTGTERNDYKYNYTGTYYEQKNIDVSKEKHTFKKYNNETEKDKGYMYTVVDGEQKSKTEMSSVGQSMNKVNMIERAFYDLRAIKRITEYLYNDGSYQYVFEYVHTSEEEQADMLSLLYGNPGASIRKDYTTVYESAKDKDGADLMRMFMFVDREGRITKQVIELKVHVKNVTINTVVNAYGYVDYYATINYRW